MESQADVVVVSAFGRGNWMASEIASQGIKTCLVETSDLLGRWTPEDWEGPFGYFYSEQLTASQQERLIEEDYTENLPEGFTLWLADGPIDFKSSLSPHLLNKSGVAASSLNFLSEYESLSPDKIHNRQREIRRGLFRDHWLVHLAYQLASNVYMPSVEGVTYGRPLPLNSPWIIRRVSRKGAIRSLEWVESKGVTVFSGAQLVDLLIEGSKVSSLEIHSSWSGAITGEQFIWMLSGEETLKLSDKIAKQLFPKGIVKSTWNWIRYRVRMGKGTFLETLPLKFVIIKDLFAPWTHTNLMIVQKTVQAQDFDVWIKIPTQHRFQRAYLEEQNQEILKILASKIPGSKPVTGDMPQDHLYEYQQLGPPRFPIYSMKDIEQLYRSFFSNVHYSATEDWTLYEWTSVLRSQIPTVAKVKKWKRE